MNASVLLDGDVVGVVAIAALDDARLITPDEQSFVASVADQVGLVLEIHKRISIERRLRESQEFLRAVIDLDPNLIFVKDETGRFTLVNQAVAAVYGAPVNQIVGKRDCDFNPNHDETSAFLNDDLRVIESGEELFIPEERITTASGEMRILQTVKRPLKIGGSSSRHVLGVSTDVTQMKQLYAQLMQSQKMEAIGQLAGGIAHDFNNILTGIIGYSDLLHDAGNDVEQVREISGSIQLAATRAAELTGKLLGFARKGKHQNVPVDMHDQIREALTILGRTVEKNILIVEKLDAVQSRVLGDPVQLEQIVFNLVINARDAMADKAASGKMGRLSLMTNIVQVGSDDAESLGVRAGRFLVLAVTDTGCGIPAKYREKIFEPFFTTKPLGEGTGMGLAMVYGIVRNHGGSVMVQSEEGQGTTFRVYLPILEGLEAHVEPLPPLRKPITGRGRILVVDDHAMIREVTADMLSALGYEVTVVEDGLEAVQYYRRSCSSLDLVILDLVMPRMGGIECFRALRQINRQVRVLLSTGYGKNLAVQELLNQGVYGFIQKPYHLSKLSEIVAEALSKDRLDAVGMPDHEQHVDA